MKTPNFSRAGASTTQSGRRPISRSSHYRQPYLHHSHLIMPPPLSVDLKQRIVHLYVEDNWTMQHISETLNVSLGLISKVVNAFRTYGTVNDPTRQYTGRPSPLYVRLHAPDCVLPCMAAGCLERPVTSRPCAFGVGPGLCLIAC